MQRTTLIALVALLSVIALVVVFFMVTTSSALRSPAALGVASDQALFSDGEYGFTLRYPQTWETDYTFKSFYHLPPAWRVNALSEATGTPILSVIGYRIESDHSYPRYFDAEVRIGASTDAREIARCLTAAIEQNEQPLPDVILGGTTFKAFSFEGAGMMQYVKGVSYRAVHDGVCIAIEKIAAGASYRDDPDSPDDVPDATLDAAYASLDPVVASFAFATP